MLTLQEVSKSYRAGTEMVMALDQVSLTVLPGDFVAVTGRSGAGKSTLVALLGGLTPPDAGQVLWAGTDLWRLPDHARSALRARTLGFVFQFASLMPTLRVLENVMLPAAFGASPPGGREWALELLDRVGLAGEVNRFAWQLSGGQQKRVAVARALFPRPQLLLADEPTADLDEETEREIAALFQAVHQEGTAVVMVTHNTDLVSLATRHLVLNRGRVQAAAVPAPAARS